MGDLMAEEKLYDICMQQDEKDLAKFAEDLGIKGLDFKDKAVKDTFCKILDGLATGPIEKKAQKAFARFLRGI